VNGVSARSTRSATSRQTNASEAFGRSAPGSRPASQSTWKPLQIPSTSPPSSANAAHGVHHRREAGDRAAAEVVAVREPAGQDDRADVRELALGVPDERRLGAERSSASAASRSSFEPGKTTTAIRGRARAHRSTSIS
jgi:hypothetical protein